MCRLLGFISPTPTTAADLIGVDDCRQWQAMGSIHDDGWGTAWIDPGAEEVTPEQRAVIYEEHARIEAEYRAIAATRERFASVLAFIGDGPERSG